MAPVAADPTIRRQVISVARDVLEMDPAAAIDELTATTLAGLGIREP